ncbi:hypothetical protein [Segniliparus rugosus]|uniref:Uncharacterized protein n=1 Tax=Segniliparus rugosus (strain ATCC BAA-974 / DSM 45345 / CCUG 50838 / CIP 108380 / JCM 13579 / CDC 945) TaxID=679197 RepID=E5XNY9_SEGRC|nr:hypothetical protein [Segniliparus rugosus]EFV13928.1 hypothetical protein HMPREF9336_01210 [Segniliparus rugosus ATCC BAA-974]
MAVEGGPEAPDELAEELEGFWSRWCDPESPDYAIAVLADTEVTILRDWMHELCPPDLRFQITRANGCVAGTLWEVKHIVVWANGWCPERWGLGGDETAETAVAAAKARVRAVSEMNRKMFPEVPGVPPAIRRDPEGPGEVTDLVAAICAVVGGAWSRAVAVFDAMLGFVAVLDRAAAGSPGRAALRDALATRIRAALDDSRRYAREFAAIGDPQTGSEERQRRYDELWAFHKDRSYVSFWERPRQVDSPSRSPLE